MRKNLFFSAMLLGLALLPVCAQSGDLPHVTQINVETRNNLIRITWVDSPEAQGPVYIFRSARPFSGAIPANIRPVVIRYGIQYYIDDTDDLGNLYYFIAASDTYGRRFDVIIPQVNNANVNLSQPDTPVAPPPVIALPEPAQGISNLNAVLDGEKAVITFNNSNPRRNVILYRGAQPIRRPADLINAVIVYSGLESQIDDYPVPGFTWYYALIYEDEIASGNVGINPGVNTTVSALIISADDSEGRSMRSIPLPSLTLRDLPGGFSPNYNRQIPLGAEAVDMLMNTPAQPKERLEVKRPRVFVIDLQAPAGGEESALSQIINEYFTRFEWERARAGLRHYLSLPRSREVESRARFYLGQTYYFTANYREALMEFLSFRSYHQIEANIWINAVLSAMVY